MTQKYRFINREISWLSFNARVLQEAQNSQLPLLERLKFLSIFSSNLDEFFRVRVGSLYRMIEHPQGYSRNFYGKPQKVLEDIKKIVLQQQNDFEDVLAFVLSELEKQNVTLVDEKQLTKHQKTAVKKYFFQSVRPSLVPLILSKESDLPELGNQIIYLAITLLSDHEPEKHQYALIRLPTNHLPRFFVLPRNKGIHSVIMLDDIIRIHLKDVFSIFDFDKAFAYTLKVTRDAEIDIEDDINESYIESLSRSISSRRTARPVRIVYDKDMPEDLLQFILKKMQLKDFQNLIPGGRYHNARDFFHFPAIGPRRIRMNYPAAIPVPSLEKAKNIFDVIQSKDILLHFPYNSFDYMIEFLRQAAIDPTVTSIKLTVYRLARDSRVMNTLMNAVSNGKDVLVLLELQARFDEKANIHWIGKLKEAGVRVLDGVPGLKVHAKVCLVTRQKGKNKQYFGVLGTGNFNEETARIYSDHLLFTAHPGITAELKQVFRFYNNNYHIPRTRHLVLSPFQTRNHWLKLIKQEIKNAKAAVKASITVKLNQLTDRDLITALYKAADAGVEVNVIARSISCAIPDKRDKLRITSIVDMYLEHSRIFIFHNGGNELLYISSADWMLRNLDNRFEVTIPVYDPDIKKQLSAFIDCQLKDNSKARILDKSLKNTFVSTDSGESLRSQTEFYRVLPQLLS